MRINNCYDYHVYLFDSEAYKLAGSFNMRGRLRQLFFVLTDDNIGSEPRPEPNSLQDPPTSFPQAELVDQAVENIRQDHMYTSDIRSTPPAAKPATAQPEDTPGSKRKLKEKEAGAGSSKRR